MRHPGLMGAFADRFGEIDSLSGFVIAFLVALVVSVVWNDVSRYPLHSPPPTPPEIIDTTHQERI